MGVFYFLILFYLEKEESTMKRTKVCFLFAIIVGLLFVSVVDASVKEPISKQEMIDAGKTLFQTKSCAVCHGLNGEKDKAGPDLMKWDSLASPVLWAAIMWNHVPEMAKTFNEKKMEYPTFGANELAYIFTYLHSFGESGGTYSFAGDEDKGAFQFQYLGCKQCHATKGKGGTVGPELTNFAGSIKNDNEFANRMLIHAPYMSKEAEALKMYWPKMQGNEMADLFAYFKSISK